MRPLVSTPPMGRSAPRGLPPEAVPLGLLLITLLALVLRVFRIGASSLWVDELITLWQGTVLGDSLWHQFLDELQSPLPMVVTSWMTHVSTSEAWLRLPGALLGAATPALLFLVARHVVRERAALLAALLLAVHPLHVYHSQEVRGYAYLLFFGLAAIAVALGARSKLSWRRAVSVGLLGTAAILSNLQGLFWMGGLALGLVVARRVRRADLERWIAAFGLMLVFSFPWWSGSMRVHETERLLPGEETGEALRGETTFSAWSLPYTAFVLSVGPTLGPTTEELYTQATGSRAQRLELLEHHLPWIVAAVFLTAVLGISGVRVLRGRRGMEVLLWALVPLVFALALAVRNVKPFNPRYVIAALPSLVLVLAAGLDALPRQRALLVLVSWLLLSAVGLDRHYFDPAYMHEDVRGAARLIEAREGANDVILAPTIYRVFEHYYHGRNPVHNFTGSAAVRPARLQARVQEMEPSRRYLWYVRSRPWHDDPRGLLLDALEDDYQIAAVFTLPGVEVRLYDRHPRPAVEPDEENETAPQEQAPAPSGNPEPGASEGGGPPVPVEGGLTPRERG